MPSMKLLRAVLLCLLSVVLVIPHTGASADEVGTEPAPPTVAGIPVVDRQLTAVTPTDWPTGDVPTYAWAADGFPIEGATGSVLVLGTEQADKTITVTLSGMSAGEPMSRTSEPTARVLRAQRPTVSGTYLVGSTLTASPGTWTEGAALTYQWFADGKAIPAAIGPTLRLASTQGHRRIAVRVTGTLDGYPVYGMTSTRSAKVVTLAARPRISGAAAVGRTLTARPGTWMSGVRIYYRWYANGSPIAGATQTTFKIPSGLRLPQGQGLRILRDLAVFVPNRGRSNAERLMCRQNLEALSRGPGLLRRARCPRRHRR